METNIQIGEPDSPSEYVDRSHRSWRSLPCLPLCMRGGSCFIVIYFTLVTLYYFHDTRHDTRGHEGGQQGVPKAQVCTECINNVK